MKKNSEFTINYPFYIKVRVWFDKDSKSWLAYSKDYDMSGYGKSPSQALEMLKFTIDDKLRMIE